MARLPTVKMKDPNNPADYVIINESDYDPVSMALWDENSTLWDENKPIDRGADILAAVYKVINSGDADSLITSGAPSVPVLEGILGFDITAYERDTAWKQYEAM